MAEYVAVHFVAQWLSCNVMLSKITIVPFNELNQ